MHISAGNVLKGVMCGAKKPQCLIARNIYAIISCLYIIENYNTQ